MKIQQLNNNERLALVSLLKLVIRADQELSADETAQMKALATEMGAETFVKTVRTAAQVFKSDDQVRSFAGSLQRTEARQLIYRRLFEAACVDAIVGAEAEVLGWLAGLWGIEIDPQTFAPTA